MNINFSGYNENVVTFKVEEGTTVLMGTPVKMSSDCTVAPCENDDTIVGVAVNVRNGYAAVELSGYIEMPAESKIEVGYVSLVSAGDNKVKESTSGREYLVVTSTDSTVGFIL